MHGQRESNQVIRIIRKHSRRSPGGKRQTHFELSFEGMAMRKKAAGDRGISKSGWAHVYALVKRIPRARVITYGELARRLRLPGGARTAGRAMAGCPAGQGIPWHRVVGGQGRLLIREPVAALQRRLLESEGVQFVGARVDFERHAWRAKTTKKVVSRAKSRPGA
jgi:methylated-DNA-protein-cysteine methyltransferase-like protein